MAEEKNNDHLKLAEKSIIKKMLDTSENEVVLFSDLVSKVNRKGKKQDRALLLTNKGIYNLHNKKIHYQAPHSNRNRSIHNNLHKIQ